MKKYVIAIDQGTTGTTSLLMDANSFEFVNKVNKEFTQIYPSPGHVEHNLNEIWKTVQETITQLLDSSNVQPEQIISIGITNQRETTCAYTKNGVPLANAIVWQDRRTSQYCDERREKYQTLQSKTGLPLDPYFSGTKMNWLLTHNPEVKESIKNNNLLLSTIDTFLLYKLTDGSSFKTEPSNASRTLLMDLDTCQWDKELLSFFEIPEDSLPTISDSFSSFGQTKGLGFLPDGIEINCILGDQQAALFGQAGYQAGDMKCTYGTGAFILLNTGTEKKYSKNGLLTTVAYKKDGKASYALEGSSYIAGAAVQWLRDNLNFFESSPEVEALANQIKSLDEMRFIQFFPFFTGIGSPYWNADAKGAILGLTRDTGKPQIARAALEGIALSINDSISAMAMDAGQEIQEIKVDGGACLNNLLMQMQANFSHSKIIRPKVIETTAYGVALGSMVGLGEITLDQLDKHWQEDNVFSPTNEDYYQIKRSSWSSTISKLFS